MIFSSVLFLYIYLPLVLLIYQLTPLKVRNLFLLIVNLIFYGWGEPVYILLMFLSIAIDYVNGYYVGKYRNIDRKKAKRFVILSVVMNLSLLGFFKYYDFFAVSLNSLLNMQLLQPLGLALPIGISFYTFQTMSYTIDIYRNQADAQKSIINFGTYVTLFPQLIAGPIVRYNDVADQLEHRESTSDMFAYGIQRFILGLAKKVLLANNIGLLWETVQKMDFGSMSVLSAWLGIIAFAFQIYFDFSGYSDMAIGLGKMFGFTFLENFNYPYISKSITEFWRRWHISLSVWFKEYVYIPLGGNRHGTLRMVLNLAIVWMLTGFWHGASWNFLWWGCYFGVLLILEKLFLKRWLDQCPALVGHCYTLFLVLISWVLFALTDGEAIAAYLRAMFALNGNTAADASALYLLANYAVLLICLIVASLPLGKTLYHRYVEGKQLYIFVPLVLGLLLLASTAYIVDASYNPFLYFRF